MRACYYPELKHTQYEKAPKLIELEEEQHHHLKNVLRMKEGDSILLIDGKGLVANCKIASIEKKRTYIDVSEIKQHEKKAKLEIVLGMTKKENIEEVAKSCVMAGVDKLSLVPFALSPLQYVPNDRLDKILISALEQSNNPFLTTIAAHKNLDDYLEHSNESQSSIICHWGFESPKAPVKLQEKVRIFIGPEGGMKKLEVQKLLTLPDTTGVTFETPILRATHAVIYSLGFIEAHRHLPN